MLKFNISNAHPVVHFTIDLVQTESSGSLCVPSSYPNAHITMRFEIRVAVLVIATMPQFEVEHWSAHLLSSHLRVLHMCRQ